jgi:hypothetical protein
MEWIFIILSLVVSGASMILTLKSRSHARLALRESRKAVAEKDVAEKALIDILDEDGNVRGRLALPGEMAKAPNTTPCGDLCAHCYFVEDGRRKTSKFSSGTWHCKAGQGAPADTVRHKFLHNNNCAMFERDND